jgi:transcriptional regulator with XRE-family HTH domain
MSGDDDMIDIHKSEWFKEISAGMTPGKVLRAYRTNRMFTQLEIAKLCGVSATTVWAMEKDRMPITKIMAKRLAAVLNCSPERFTNPS